MLFTKSTESIEEIRKFQPSVRSHFDVNNTYTIKDSHICNILRLKPNSRLYFLNSAYSRYDSASIYYFIDGENNLSEIWFGDGEKIEELMEIFEIVEGV